MNRWAVGGLRDVDEGERSPATAAGAGTASVGAVAATTEAAGTTARIEAPGGLTSIVPLIVVPSRDSRAAGNGPVPLITWPVTTLIALKSKTATPWETTPVKVPPGPVNVGVPPVSIV